MSRINKVTVAWDGLLANLCRVICKWQPQDFPRERDYRDSLTAYLRANAPGARIECEYRHLGTTADISVEWDGFISTERVLIELKRNLNSKSEFNRLVGQIADLRPHQTPIIVVLCGETSPQWLDRLKATFKPSWLPPALAIIVRESVTSPSSP
jgi:hypothetical protein